MAVYGIDLGTTYSAIATLDESGQPRIIENQDESTATLASAVYFPDDGGDAVVGTQAKDIAATEPDRVAQFAKRYIGKPNEDDVARRDGLKANFDYNGNTENPITISSYILKRIVEYATYQGYEVEDVVITCPAYFTDEERRATRQAGESIELNVINIINEPTAAALSYCYNGYKEDKKILVYDLGGGTFDVAIVNMKVDDDKNVTVDAIRTGGNDKLGGVDWDNMLYDYVAAEFADQNGIDTNDIDDELSYQIKSKVETTKKSLSNVQTKNITIHYEGEPTSIEVSREKFEELTKDLVDQTIYFVDDVLGKAELSSDDIDDVLLVGGSTLMPVIMDTIKAKFSKSKVIRNDPHLAVAKGAAIFAGINVNEGYDTPQSSSNEQPTHGQQSDDDDFSSSSDSRVEHSEQQPVRPPILVNPGFSSIDRLSHSYGPTVLIGDDDDERFVIDNLAFIGDIPPIEVSNTYRARSSIVEVDFYSNDSEKDSAEHYVTPSKDQNGDEQWTDPSLNVRYMGSARLENSRIQAGDSITVTITITNKGSYASVRHDDTNEIDTCEFISENTLSQEEIEDAKNRFKLIKTRSDV